VKLQEQSKTQRKQVKTVKSNTVNNTHNATANYMEQKKYYFFLNAEQHKIRRKKKNPKSKIKIKLLSLATAPKSC